MNEFDREIERANERAKQQRQREPWAVAARYDGDAKRVVIELSNGSAWAFPPARAQGLQHASPTDLAEIEVTPSGYGLHFPKLDADLWLPALMAGVFGSRAWTAAQMGARGGRAKSEAKTAAARANGTLGGRPLLKAAKTKRAAKSAKKRRRAHTAQKPLRRRG